VKKVKTILIILLVLVWQFILNNKSYASTSSGNYKYDNLSDGTISIVGYTGTEQTVTVPSMIDNKKVTMIGILAFENNSTVKTIILPEGILGIDAYAFDSCPNLTTVKMPSTLNYISNIFKNACPKLTEYTIPSTLTQLSDGSYRKIVNVNISGTYNYDKAKEVVDLVNEERSKLGLSLLTIDNSLMESAMQRATEISIYWDHDRPNGLSCFSVNKKINGENIGVGSSSTLNIMDKWMNSSGHKAQIVKETHKAIGVGCYQINGLTYWVQLFSKSNSDNENTLSGKKDVNNTVEVAVGKGYIDISIKGINENNTLFIGETLSPTSVKNTNAGYKSAKTSIAFSDLTWKSSDTNVFTVDKNGKITATGQGKAVLTASIGDATATYNITVLDNIHIESIILDKENINLEEGESGKIVATILPNDTTDDKTITWESSNNAVVTIDNNGNLKAISNGTAIITATTSNGKTAQCYVLVNKFIPLSSVNLKLKKERLVIGEQTKLTVSLNPTNATYREVLFRSSNENVATVDEKGNITAVGEGVCNILAKGFSSKDKTQMTPETYVTVFVVNPVKSISLNKSNISFSYKNQTEKLGAIILPEDASEKEVYWTSDDESIATVNQEGVVTALKNGTTIITAKTLDGSELTATCNVKVQILDIIYTTIPTAEISSKDIMVFNKNTSFNTILTSEKFPILDINYKVKLYNLSNNIKNNNEKIGSRNVIKIEDLSGNIVAEYTIVVKGDVTGNGYARMYDAFQILKDTIIPGVTLDEIDVKIRDYNEDGNVRMYDAFQFLKDSILG